MDLSFTELDSLKPELGAEFTGEGTHFALFSAHAEKVELCLFAKDGKRETARLALPNREGDIWSGFIAGLSPGTIYGYRVHGPYDPANGHRFNHNKLLLDPYAKQIFGRLQWHDALFGYQVGDAQADLSFDERDSAPFMVKAVVQDPDFDWSGEEAIRRPWNDTIIYEAHVRGLTMLHPKIPDEVRGTFRGMAHPVIIDHLTRLGITAIELLPVQHFVDDQHLIDKGLSNYWGYQPLGYFAPEPRYLSSGSIQEFKSAVKAFHAAGIEVILDVVYNHTAEGSELGPTLGFRGIDNMSYYRQSPQEFRHTFDTTGTGNTLNVAHPMVLRMVLDSLRYWVTAMHVDGFRFDLASALGREDLDFDREGGFFDAIRQDPVLAGVKLIAEPWDVGDGGYQLGGFPPPFREWNDRFRDDVRRFWRRDEGMLPSLAQRLAGSSVEFNHAGRTATSSINLVSAHDGFTLADVVSFNERHNAANGEENQDGHSANHSDNLGAEGPTEDREITERRFCRRRALLATLMLSQGVPMILGGDELGNSQAGNNNSYCQDNSTGWIDWGAANPDFLEFCRSVVAFRSGHGLVKQNQFLDEEAVRWFAAEGQVMSQQLWEDPKTSIVGMLLLGDGQQADLLIVMNAGEECHFMLPREYKEGLRWRRVLDSGTGDFSDRAANVVELVPGQSVVVFLADT
ncbi:glycogen debranching protein GlgX (plasmid) [Ensifer adhaerens]|uniref:glycogen debranching protein GlgX n=1 Tax=Ensifer adhaerens TaxID=106592 RepID=UPI001CBD123E|nr:glycogen debranching protein GlgX [Ensifer adhaerens]MBZ7927648.1 glycogen debranching protein GlgX [Ensifer adhaerens]UAX98045.1 glycogen debranching protein GlgX [Ensifer adhaerens]UAY05426.1 glycogen debranching protein GlgX [Ensifer adhaerens]UAY12804.1 glycogen debranching protein GlgX [Ensifer adhaerens]